MDESIAKSFSVRNGSLETGIEKELISVTSHKNYPNPFSGSTTISFELEKNAHVSLAVFDINGRLITSLLDESVESGYHEVKFSAESVSPGLYTYILRTGNQMVNGKMIINR